MTFSDKIKKIRLDNNLTQQQFADKLSISRSVVAKWEQDRGMPSLDLLKKISKTFDVPVEYLLGEKESIANVQHGEDGQSNPAKLKNKGLKPFFRTISIILGIMIILSVFIIPPIVERLIWVENTFDTSFYGIATVDDEKIVIERTVLSNKVEKFVIKKSDVIDLSILDVSDNPTNLQSIKSGNRIIVYYKSIDRYKSEREIEYQKIKIIDDYYLGEKGLKGFFVSLTEYTGDKPPINSPDFGYVNPEYENIDGNALYPFVCYMQRDTSFHYTYGGVIRNSSFQKHYIIVARNATVYVYILDDSEKGYSLYGRLNYNNPSIKLPDLIGFKESYKDDLNHRYSVRKSVDFELQFTSTKCTTTSIIEYDKTHNVIVERVITSYDELWALPSKYMLNDATRYFKVKVDGYYKVDENNSDTFVAGAKIDLNIATASGFIDKRTINFY